MAHDLQLRPIDERPKIPRTDQVQSYRRHIDQAKELCTCENVSYLAEQIGQTWRVQPMHVWATLDCIGDVIMALSRSADEHALRLKLYARRLAGCYTLFQRGMALDYADNEGVQAPVESLVKLIALKQAGSNYIVYAYGLTGSLTQRLFAFLVDKAIEDLFVAALGYDYTTCRGRLQYVGLLTGTVAIATMSARKTGRFSVQWTCHRLRVTNTLAAYNQTMLANRVDCPLFFRQLDNCLGCYRQCKNTTLDQEYVRIDSCQFCGAYKPVIPVEDCCVDCCLRGGHINKQTALLLQVLF